MTKHRSIKFMLGVNLLFIGFMVGIYSIARQLDQPQMSRTEFLKMQTRAIDEKAERHFKEMRKMLEDNRTKGANR